MRLPEDALPGGGKLCRFGFYMIHISLHCPTEDAPWYVTTNGRLWLLTSAAAVALFVFILSVSVFVCRRAKRIRTSKGPM